MANAPTAQRPDNPLVFIGASSLDYGFAEELHAFLTANNVRSFFAKASLPELGRSDYRQEIDDALDRTVHMIVVTSSADNVRSRWLEAEWGFFVNEKRSGRKDGNLVTVVVGDMPPASLPPSLRYYEVIPFAEFSRVLRYVSRVADQSPTSVDVKRPVAPQPTRPHWSGRIVGETKQPAVAVSPPVALRVSGTDTARLEDDFSRPGNTLNLSVWTTEFGSSSFLGRTQLRDWVNGSGTGPFIVANGTAQLALDTFNPTGFSLYGTHARTRMSFQPSAHAPIVFTTRLRLTSLQPGLVYGVYLFGQVGTLVHDEIDIELMTNLLQPEEPMRVLLNRYAHESTGSGHGVLADLPPGFDPLAVHDWSIIWSPRKIDYLVDGAVLYSVTSLIPQGPMQANLVVWGPDANWSQAFSPSVQPVGSPAENRRFCALVSGVVVGQLAGTEPALSEHPA